MLGGPVTYASKPLSAVGSERHHVPSMRGISARFAHDSEHEPSVLLPALSTRTVGRRNIVQEAVHSVWLDCLNALHAGDELEPDSTLEQSGMMRTLAADTRKRALLLEATRQAVWAELIDQSTDTQRSRLLAMGMDALFGSAPNSLLPIAQTLNESASLLRQTLIAARVRGHTILETLLSWAPDLSISSRQLLRTQLFATEQTEQAR